jgi:hypothetical protein
MRTPQDEGRCASSGLRPFLVLKTVCPADHEKGHNERGTRQRGQTRCRDMYSRAERRRRLRTGTRLAFASSASTCMPYPRLSLHVLINSLDGYPLPKPAVLRRNRKESTSQPAADPSAPGSTNASSLLQQAQVDLDVPLSTSTALTSFRRCST